MQVKEDPQLYMHAKIIVVDNKVAFVGSENISAQSLDQNGALARRKPRHVNGRVRVCSLQPRPHYRFCGREKEDILMKNYQVRRVSLGKTNQCDELARECGRLYSQTLVSFWRTVRKQGIWLGPNT